MAKRTTILIAVLLLIDTFVNPNLIAEKKFAHGGGLLVTIPQIVGAYSWKSFMINSGLGFKESGTVFSAGGRYYFHLSKDLMVEPYLGASLLMAKTETNGLTPSTFPTSNKASTTVEPKGINH